MSSFNKRFLSDDDCLAFLTAIKWHDEHYICCKCGNTTYRQVAILVLMQPIQV